MAAPEPVLFDALVPSPLGGFGPRITSHYELVVVSRGYTVSSIDGVSVGRLGPSAVAILFPGQTILHEFDAEPEAHTEGWWLHVPPSAVAQALAERLALALPVIPLSEQMVRMTANLMALKSSTLPTCGEIAASLAVAMLWCYVGDAERADTAAKRGGRPDTIELAQTYIREHLDEPMTLEDIARASSCSRTNLIRLFRTHVGLTPFEYVWQCRVDRGVSLLEETGLTIGEIAERSGFQTPFHFSRVVKQRNGLTPTEIRRRAWTGTTDGP